MVALPNVSIPTGISTPLSKLLLELPVYQPSHRKITNRDAHPWRTGGPVVDSQVLVDAAVRFSSTPRSLVVVEVQQVDGEGPVGTVASFDLTTHAVTNNKWAKFAGLTRFTTASERLSSIFMFGGLLPDDFLPQRAGLPRHRGGA